METNNNQGEERQIPSTAPKAPVMIDLNKYRTPGEP